MQSFSSVGINSLRRESRLQCQPKPARRDNPGPTSRRRQTLLPKKPLAMMMGPSNHIYVGKKPVMSYAMSALIQLSQAGEVNIKARGLAISRAVDVAEIVTKTTRERHFQREEHQHQHRASQEHRDRRDAQRLLDRDPRRQVGLLRNASASLSAPPANLAEKPKP